MKTWDGNGVKEWSQGYTINQGGLMRCCLDTIYKLCQSENEPKDGQEIDCIHEQPGNRSIIVRDKTFRWNRPETIS